MQREYVDHVEALRADLPNLAAEVASFRGMESVIQWMQRRGLANAAVDLIGMDEFSYDFLIELQPDDHWIAFGVT